LDGSYALLCLTENESDSVGFEGENEAKSGIETRKFAGRSKGEWVGITMYIPKWSRYRRKAKATAAG